MLKINYKNDNIKNIIHETIFINKNNIEKRNKIIPKKIPISGIGLFSQIIGTLDLKLLINEVEKLSTEIFPDDFELILTQLFENFEIQPFHLKIFTINLYNHALLKINVEMKKKIKKKFNYLVKDFMETN